MKTKEDSNYADRQIGAPFTCRYWRDNHERIMEISRKIGRKPGEVARDLMDDALATAGAAMERGGRVRSIDDLIDDLLGDALATVGANDKVDNKIDLLIKQNSQMAGRYERLFHRYERLAKRNENLRNELIRSLRELQGILLGILSAIA